MCMSPTIIRINAVEKMITNKRLPLISTDNSRIVNDLYYVSYFSL